MDPLEIFRHTPIGMLYLQTLFTMLSANQEMGKPTVPNVIQGIQSATVLSDKQGAYTPGKVKTNVDYYAALEVSKYASTKDIKQAYLRLAKIKHPDKSKSPNAHEEFSLLQEAYSTLIDPKKRVEYDFNYKAEANPLLIKPPFLNEKTFYYLSPVDEIDSSKLMELDGYAFDVDELIEYAKQDIYKLAKNPHILDRNQNADFSNAAKNKMKTNPVLNQHLIELESRLVSQQKGIKPQTVDAVIEMLTMFHQRGVEGSADARVKLIEHKHTLTAAEQNQLDNFLIRMPCIQGGFQTLPFNQAINGGNHTDQCILTAQMYGWQFVVMVRPAAVVKVPQSVKDLARRHFVKIEAPSEEPNRQAPSPVINEESRPFFGPPLPPPRDLPLFAGLFEAVLNGMARSLARSVASRPGPIRFQNIGFFSPRPAGIIIDLGDINVAPEENSPRPLFRM